MRRNSKSSTSLVSLSSLGNSNGKGSLRKMKSRLAFLGNKKGSMARVTSSISLVSLDGKRSPLNVSTTQKKSSMTRNSRSMTSLKALQTESSPTSSFSHLVTPSALSVLKQVDDSLRQVGHTIFQHISRDVSSNKIYELTEHDDDEYFPLFIEDDDPIATRNPSSSPQGKHIQRVDRDNFHRVCQIGRGAHSNVYMVLDHKRERCALKALDSSRLKTSEEFITAALDFAMEAKILSNLDHENIIQLRGVCSRDFSASFTARDHEGYFLVFDLLSDILSDSLDRWRKNNRQKMVFENKWTFGKSKVNTAMMYGRMQSVALGIVKGMVYLHENEIVIRDLKPANIGFDEEGNVRLFDFGMARKLDDCDPNELCGSPRYMPPEVMAGNGYSYEADVYSFGVILYEICSLNVAFDTIRKYDDWKKTNRLVIIEQNMRPKLNKIECPLTKKLIEDCWQGDPTQRPSFIGIYKRIVDITSCQNDKAQTISG